MKKTNFLWVVLLSLILLGCGSSSSESDNSYTISSSSNNALMGPLKNATVNVYRLNELNTSIESTNTNDLGAFSLSLNGIDDNEMLLISVSGGTDIDANDDGIIDNVPTQNKGTINGLAKAGDLKNGIVNITLLSDVLYRYVEHLIGNVQQDDLENIMNQYSAKLLKSSISRDVVSYKDINKFNPINKEFKEQLSFNYDDLIKSDSLADAIHNDSNVTVIDDKLNTLFGAELTLRDTRVFDNLEYYKIKVIIPYNTKLEYNGNEINDTMYYNTFVKKDSNATFKLILPTNISIDKWDGCDQISDDLSTCTIKNIDHNIIITPITKYVTNLYADNVKNISDYYVDIRDNNYTISLDLDANDTQKSFIDSINVGDIIVSDKGDNRFIKKVINKTKIDDYNYLFEVNNTSFVDLYKEGSNVQSKSLTYNDLVDNVDTINRSLSKYNVSLKKPSNLNDKEFTLVFDQPTINRAIEDSLGAELQLIDGVTVKGTISFKLDYDFDYNVEWFKLKSLRFVLKKEVKNELKVEFTKAFLEVGANNSLKKALLPTPLVFRIPAGPLFINLEVQFYLGAEGKIEAAASIGGQYTTKTQNGFNYNNGYISFINDKSDSASSILDSEPVKLSAGVYALMDPKITIVDTFGLELSTKLGIYGEIGPKFDAITGDGELKAKLEAKLINQLGFAWASWLEDYEWARAFQNNLNERLSNNDSGFSIVYSYLIKEWDLTPNLQPAYLDLTSEPIDINVYSNQSVDKLYTFKIKNSGEQDLDWNVTQIEEIPGLVTVSPKEGTLAKGEEVNVLVTVKKDDLSNLNGVYKNKLIFNNNSSDGSDVETGTSNVNVILNVQKYLNSPSDLTSALEGDSIKKLHFTWTYNDNDIDGFNIYKANFNTDTNECDENYSLFEVVDTNYIRDISLYFDNYVDNTNLAKNIEAGKSYCFKLSAYKDNIESNMSNMTKLDIPDYGSLVSAIKDNNNTPIEATIRLTRVSDVTSSDENGDFNFDKLMPGTYRITIEAPGYITVVIPEYEIHSGVNILEQILTSSQELENETGSYKGILKDAVNGNAISGATIEVRKDRDNYNGDIIKTITTDENGNYILDDLETGYYTLTIKKDNYIQTTENIYVVGGETTTKDLSISPLLSSGEMRIKLSWGQYPSDLDSHLVKRVDGEMIYHIYYSNKVFGDDNLDVDDTTSYGPETITISDVDPSATYTYYVYKYAGTGDLKDSSAKVEVYYGDKTYTFNVPNQDGEYWKVFDIINGEIQACTSNCIQSVEYDGVARNISINDDSKLFIGLPAK